MQKKYWIIVLTAIVFGIGGFGGGVKFQQSQVQPTSPAGTRQNRFPGQGQNGMRPVAGEILSVDEKSLTVKLADGSSKIILLSGKTTLNKAAEATTSDLKIGLRVAVFGTVNPDGSVTAQNVQISPTFGGGRPGM